MKEDIFKKDAEFFNLTFLLNALNINTKNVIKSESPDFRFEFEDKLIGLELVGCHSLDIESNGKLGIAKTNKAIYDILNDYKKKQTQKGNYKIITVSFRDDIYYHAKLKSKSKEIIEEIEYDIECSQDSNIERRDYKYIKMADANTYPNLTFCDFVITDAYWGRSIIKEHIIKRITEKENKLATYKTKANNKDIEEYWLAIDFSQDRDIVFTNINQPLRIRTEYDRVYLIKQGDVKRIV